MGSKFVDAYTILGKSIEILAYLAFCTIFYQLQRPDLYILLTDFVSLILQSRSTYVISAKKHPILI